MKQSKICTKCKEDKLASLYPTQMAARDGLGSWCKLCVKQLGANNYKKYRSDRKESMNAARRKWGLENPDKIRNAALMRQYGISLDTYLCILTNQKECCRICGLNQKDVSIKLSVDHCHATGKVRGLLCRDCNLLLGKAKDSVFILEEAIKYLKETYENKD